MSKQDTGPRLIVHQDAPAVMQKDAAGVITTGGSNWTFDIDSTSWKAVCVDSIDLHGYVPDDLTFQISEVAIQISGPPSWTDFATVAANRNELYASHQLYVTTSPIALGATEFNSRVPGFLGVQPGDQEIYGLSPSEVIYGHIATYQSVNTIQTSLYALTQTNFSQFGLGKPVVSDRLYVYQQWRVDSVNDIMAGSAALLGSLVVPAQNIILVGASKEEPDYMYMHRMAQQYQLQQSYDED
jgi:hypothetical protein